MNTKFNWLCVFFLSLGVLITQEATQSKTTPVENLADGVYTYCDLPQTAPREKFAMCFSFRKTGERIVGIYYPDRSDFEDICIEGRVKGNTVSGFALESVEGPLSEHIPTSEGETLVNWWDNRGNRGYLKVAKKHIIERNPTPNDYPTTGWVRFDSALLNLNGFSRWTYTERVPNRCTVDEIEKTYR